MVEATTADGKRVNLSDDGTWVLIEPTRADQGGASFRKSRWGETRAEVSRGEGREPDAEQSDTIAYAVQVAELDATALYIFVDDQLVRAKYLITQEHSDHNLFLRDFKTLSDLLAAKYGRAKAEDEYWINDLFKDTPSDYGTAVASGHLSRFTVWSSADTRVTLALSGDNYEVDLQIEYAGLAFEDLESSQRHAAALEDL